VTKTIGIYLFDDVEVLDFAGPFEVFSTAARLHARSVPGDQPLLAVTLIAARRAHVTARGGLVVMPEHDLRSHPALEVVIIPGGIIEAELERPELIEWLRAVSPSAEVVASVCTGAFILAQAGLLDGRPATTHWEDLEDFRTRFPDVRVDAGRRWTNEGKWFTSAGISAGIDMSLHLVERMACQALARRTARQMDYSWVVQETGGTGR